MKLINISILVSVFLVFTQAHGQVGYSEKSYVLQSTSEGQEKLIVYPLGQQLRAIHLFEYKHQKKTPDFLKTLEFLNTDELDQFLSQYKSVQYETIQRGMQEPTFKATRNHTKIWETQHQWSLDWESQYSQWIQDHVDENFFVEQNIKTDCADVAVTLRWIFARMHGLPAAFRLAGSDQLFTNESMRSAWVNYGTHTNWREDRLFMASLNYIAGMTYTHSILQDSYPVQADLKYFGPGIHHLNMHSADTGHTLFLYRMGAEYGGIATMFSNVPRIVRRLALRTFKKSYQYTNKRQGGLFKFRWPVNSDGLWQLVEEEQMPGYSPEQYSSSFMGEHSDFYKALLEKLDLYVNPVQDYEANMLSLLGQIEDRIEVVQEGFATCQSSDCTPGTANYENWSTPTRDNRLHDTLIRLEDLAYDDDSLSYRWHEDLQNIEYTVNGQVIVLEDIFFGFIFGSMSYDPRDSINMRWGL